MKWFLGGQEDPGRKERVKLELPPEISVQSIPDDRTLNSMLESGEIDASQQFTAQIWKMWEAGKPVSTWMKQKPYHVPGTIPFLIFNLNKPGLDNPKVRLAIAYSIDYANIATTAMSDYSEPANASLIIPTGYESKFSVNGMGRAMRARASPFSLPTVARMKPA